MVYLGGGGSQKSCLFSESCHSVLATACYIHTKLLRPFVRRWRAAGLNSIDDGICSAESYCRASTAASIITNDLRDACFVLNNQKSCKAYSHARRAC